MLHYLVLNHKRTQIVKVAKNRYIVKSLVFFSFITILYLFKETSFDMSERIQQDSAVASVLLVDDNQDSLALRKVFLARQGFVVTSASSSMEAITLLKQKIFNLVISDGQMPPSDGCDLLKVIKTEYRDLKVLMMGDDTIEKEDVLRKGALELLLKPFPHSEFLFKIQMTLDEKRRAYRFRCNNVQCRMKNVAQQDVGVGTIADISLEGVLVETEEEIAIQETGAVYLEFFTADSSQKLMEVSGNIVRQLLKEGNDVTMVAISFNTERSLEILEHLKQFISID